MEMIEFLRIFLTAFLLFLILKLKGNVKSHHSAKGTPIPGPRGLPFIGSFLDLIRAGYKPEELMLKWRNKFGDIFCFKLGSKQVVVLNNYELINAAWHHPDLQGRDTSVVATQIFGKGKGVIFTYGPEWKEHRQFILGMFRKFGLGKSSFEKTILDEGERLAKEIRRHKGKSIDVSFIYSMASCSIISKLIFNHQLEYTDPIFLQNLKLILEGFRLAGPGNLFNLVPFISALPIGFGSAMKDNLRKTKGIWQNDIDSHKRNTGNGNGINGASVNDIIDEYLRRMLAFKADDKKQNLYKDEHLIYVVRDLYLAGTETVATTFRWATLLLMTHPHVQKECQEEIRHVLGRSQKPTLLDRLKLPFVNATITEIQRVGNILPLGLPHGAVNDVDLKGYHISKGSIIFSNVHAVGTDPRLWDEPLTFRPSRHIDSEGKYVKPKEIFPFGIGKRICAGEQLARSELFLWFTSILNTFNILPPDDGSNIPDFTTGVTGMVRLPHSFRVRFEERTD